MLYLFLINSIFLLFLTVVIASITLLERKVLALVQRRVGPNYIGYKGRLQFIADALKLLVKHIYILRPTNRFLFLFLPSIALILCYCFWLNINWGPNFMLCEIEYNLLFLGVLSSLFSLVLFLTGWLTKNKYSILASNRLVIVFFTLELFLSFCIIILITLFESFAFTHIVSFQWSFTYGIILCLPILPVCLVIFFLETGRIPFDFGEAESELISGYTTEMGGFFFALFYLSEYFHLLCFSGVFSLCFLGGWH